jgi:WD40 repeat protein
MDRGKDKQIRLWDAIGGMCVQTLADCLGEITSVEFDREGKYLLAGCKDNSNRLFDLRMVRLLVLLPLPLSFPPISLFSHCTVHGERPLIVVRRRADNSNETCTVTQATKTHPKT